MGAITPEKKLYDNCAVEVFQRAGWKAFSVARTGRYNDKNSQMLRVSEKRKEAVQVP